uniref:Putative acyltransferase n=1 Tax=Desulfovibrio sp. U5L TaxID=596152 RepID=I2Q4C9_9BACT
MDMRAGYGLLVQSCLLPFFKTFHERIDTASRRLVTQKMGHTPENGFRGERLGQIDILKGLAILCVLAQHCLTLRMLDQSWYLLHIGQAVPLFMVLMGYNARRSALVAPQSAPLYSREYFGKYFHRILYPFLFILAGSFAFSWLDGVVYGRPFPPIDLTLFLGRLPSEGVGNYFIPLLFQFILVFPLLNRWCSSHLPSFLWGCLVLDVAFELLCRNLPLQGPTAAFLYTGCVFRYLFAVALGAWLAQMRPNGRLDARQWAGALVSLGFLVAWYATDGTWYPFNPLSGGISCLIAGYPLGLAALGLRRLPVTPQKAGSRLLASLGKLSYHIYLVQMLYFVSIYRFLDLMFFSRIIPGDARFLVGLFVHIPACVLLGWLFQRVERSVWDFLGRSGLPLFGTHDGPRQASGISMVQPRKD